VFARKTTCEDAAGCIEDFLCHKGKPYDWDDFTTLPIRHDAELDAIRLRCFHLRDEYPPAPGQRVYCSDEGMAVLKNILAQLRAKIAGSDTQGHE
jgi:hypothetical protein